MLISLRKRFPPVWVELGCPTCFSLYFECCSWVLISALSGLVESPRNMQRILGKNRILQFCLFRVMHRAAALILHLEGLFKLNLTPFFRRGKLTLKIKSRGSYGCCATKIPADFQIAFFEKAPFTAYFMSTDFTASGKIGLTESPSRRISTSS